MRFVIQRVNHAKCTIDGNITGSIEKGLCVLIGIAETDTKEVADKMYQSCLIMQRCTLSVVWVQEKKMCGLPLQNSLSVSVLPTRRLPYKTINCPLFSSYLSFRNCNSASLPINIKAPPYISNPDLLNPDLISLCPLLSLKSIG